jgi:hypothetical protein
MAKTKKTRRADTSREAHASDPVSAYARAVGAGSIVAGPHVRNACQRHLKDLKEGPKRGLCWDVDAAQRALGFFPDVLRLAGGQFEGLPFALQPSQAFIVGSLFGWKRKDGWRRFRRAYIEEGKGNGKSPLAAGIGLYGMMADGEDRAEVYAAASDRDQAMVLFRDAVAMVDQSPALDNRVTQSGENPVWQLTDLRTASFFKPLSREKRKKGSNPLPHSALSHSSGAAEEQIGRLDPEKGALDTGVLPQIVGGAYREDVAEFQDHRARRHAHGPMGILFREDDAQPLLVLNFGDDLPDGLDDDRRQSQ